MKTMGRARGPLFSYRRTPFIALAASRRLEGEGVWSEELEYEMDCARVH